MDCVNLGTSETESRKFRNVLHYFEKEISHISTVSSYRTYRKIIFSILVLILINLQEVVHFNAGEKNKSGSKTDLDSKESKLLHLNFTT